MTWRSGQPIDRGYYLCAIIGNNQPTELFWDGSDWFYQNEDWPTFENNQVAYYMYLGDISMPEGW